MFGVGIELDRRVLRDKGKMAVSVSVTSIALPFVLGALLALYLAASHQPANQRALVLFIGAAMSLTAFPVLARILSDRKMSAQRTWR